MLAAYWSRFEGVDGQVKKTLDRNNWRIFGRVISRQSLLSLSRSLDDIRRQSSVLINGSGENRAMLDGLAASQASFASTLEENAAGLGRSQGAEWVGDVRREFAAVIASRGRLAELDALNPQGLGAFEGRAQELRGVVREVAEGVSRRVAASRARSDEIAPGGGASAGAGARLTRDAGTQRAAAPQAEVDSARVGANAVTSAQRALDGGRRSGPSVEVAPSVGVGPSAGAATHDSSAPAGGRAIAAISGLVLLILFVISVATVRSIVVPIRQFMLTTELLAAGDENARFVRGGIKELDALAVSFNRMAKSLAEARTATREYQGALESRVDQRTRQLRHLAEHDPLTGLPNRRQLVTHLNAALEHAEREGLRVAVFFLDIDNFKNINDSMGHAFGDLVLKGVAQRLREAAEPLGFAARLGGDEFTVVQTNAGNGEEVAEVGAALMQAFQRPLSIEGRELVISIRGGASLYPEHERESGAPAIPIAAGT